MSTIFVSHSEKDLTTVNEIISGLEQAGYLTWYFERDVLPGTSYLVQIHDAVAQCDAVVLVVSSNSISSDQTTKEVVGAFERRKPFFPILLDMTPPELKQRQPEWRHALGGTAMICVGAKPVSECVHQVIEGLKIRGLHPEGEERAPSAQRAVIAAPEKTLPTSLREKILSSRASMEGERKQVTVLFADVSGFTSLSEDMDPEQVRDIMKQCLGAMSEEIERYEGTVAHFLGDGVMALFGAPIAHEDDPQRALHAALGIRERLRDQARKMRQQGLEFDVHLGLNTGLVVVGRIGEDLSMEYTAMGDTVNLASRMQSTAGPGAIRVAESTYRLTEGYFDFQPLGEVEVKGKKQAVKAYELLRAGRAKTRLGVSVARGLTPFVGRESELQQLLKCYERVKKGQGQVVGIVGEPGVGKSRLVLRMKEAIPQDECTCLQGECLHYGESIPYLPVLDILRSYFGLEEGESEPTAKKRMKEKVRRLDHRLENLLPPLHDILSLKVEDEPYLKLEPQRKRERTFEAVRNLWIRESQSRPLIVIVEDLHWMDKTSEEFLDHVIGRLLGARLLLLLLYRPEYSNPWTSKTYYSQIPLDEFPPNTSTQMVQALFREGRAAPELSDLILKKAAGNALFIEEFTRALLDRGYVRRSDGQYALAIEQSEIHVPETIQGIIGARIDSLEEDIKETLQVASVIGREFPLAILERVLTGERGLEDHLSALQRLELVYEKSVFPEMEYVFKHALTQEVAYNSLLLKKRRDIHSRIGKAIEEFHPDRLEEFCEVLAHHYAKAEDWEKSHQYLVMSADKATLSYSAGEGFRFIKEAVDALARLPACEENKRRSVDLRVRMATAGLALGYPEGTLTIFQEGERLAGELGDERSRARLRASIGSYYNYLGDPVRATQYCESAFADAERAQDIALMTGVGFDLCQGHSVTGAVENVAEVAAKITTLIEKVGKQSEMFGFAYQPYCMFLTYYGFGTGWVGNFRDGEERLEKALHLAREIGNRYNQLLAEYLYGAVLCQKGDGQNGLPHLQQAVRLCVETGAVGVEPVFRYYLGWACVLVGDCQRALDGINEGVEVQERLGLPGYLLGSGRLFRGQAYLGLENPAMARISLEEALRLARATQERWIEAMALIYLGRTLGKLDANNVKQAEEDIQQGIHIQEELKTRPSSAVGYLYLGELYAGAGRQHEAVEALNRGKAAFQDMGMDCWLAKAEKALEKLETSG